MKVTAVLNIKGGTGKSITAEVLGKNYAKAGKKTLLIDQDGQGDLSSIILPNINFDEDGSEASKRTLTGYFNGTPLKECIWKTDIPNLDLIPCNMDMFETVYTLNGKSNNQWIIYNMLKELDYDEVVIDNNPSISTLTYNAIYAADEILIPTSIGKKTIKGVNDTIKKCLNAIASSPMPKKLNISILLTMMVRNKVNQEGARQLREIFGNMVLDTEIRYQAKPVQEAEFGGMDITENTKAGISDDYRRMFEEIVEREGK